jgi:hypothetical protein
MIMLRFSMIQRLTSAKSLGERLPGTTSRGCGRTAIGTASSHRPRPPDIRLTLTPTSWAKPSFGVIQTAIGNPVSRGANFAVR